MVFATENNVQYLEDTWKFTLFFNSLEHSGPFIHHVI